MQEGNELFIIILILDDSVSMLGIILKEESISGKVVTNESIVQDKKGEDDPPIGNEEIPD